MSLTNDMLKNLEKRQPENKQKKDVLNDLEPSASNAPYYFTYIVYFIIVIVLIGILYTVFHLSLKQLRPHNQSETTIIISKSSIPPGLQRRAENNAIANKPAVALPTNPPENDKLDAINAGPREVKTPIAENVQDKITQDYQIALGLIAQNQTTAAMQQLKKILDLFPEFQPARLALATLYIQQNNNEPAIKLLADGLRSQPGNLELTILYARALIANENYQDALQALKNANSEEANNNPIYNDLLASAYLQSGNYAQAISLYQALLNQDPGNSRWLVALANAYDKNGDRQKALATYEKADSNGQLEPQLQTYVSARVRALGG